MLGGTFTDVVVIDDRDRVIRSTKVPSTPRNPDQGVLTGIDMAYRSFRINPAQVTSLMHGTTVATNALIERRGVAAALLVIPPRVS